MVKNEKEFLLNYDSTAFEKLSLSVDTVIFSLDIAEQTTNYRKLDEQKLTVLLVKRSDYPFMGKWSLPGGFVGIREGIDEAAMRVIQNKTGLCNVYVEPLATFGAPDRDPRMRIVSAAYLSLIDRSKNAIQPSPLVAGSAWFEIEVLGHELILTCQEENLRFSFEKQEIRNGKIKSVQYKVSDQTDLAFDHAAILLEGLMHLRDKIENTDIVFNLMPEEFSLTQLQQIYEIILGEKLLTPAFRRKIAPKLKETGRYSQEKGHRPSQFFTYKQERE